MIEYLRFLYTREVRLNEDLAMKLIKLADKYVQNDLSEKCLDFLKFTIKSENAFRRFDFAFEQNLDELKDFYENYFKSNIEVKSLPDLIQYLEKLPEVRLSVVNFIVNKFKEVFKEYKNNWSFYEDFLIKNVDMSTISLFVNFIYWKYTDKYKMSEEEKKEKKEEEEEEEEEEDSEAGEEIEQNTLRLNQACFDFAERNFKEIHQTGIALELPNKFLADLAILVMNSPTSHL